MTDLQDVADRSRGPEIALTSGLGGRGEFRHETTELVDADELTPEGEFPEYGEYLLCEERSAVDHTPRGEVYVEVCSQLAERLVEIGTGRWWNVTGVEKVDGAWVVDVEAGPKGDAMSLEDAAGGTE